MVKSTYKLYQKLKETRYLYELKDFKAADKSFSEINFYLERSISPEKVELLERTSFEMNYGVVIEMLKEFQEIIREKMFDFKCSKNWLDMDITDDNNIRFCQDCKKNVYFVNNELEYEMRASSGQCVAINFAPNIEYKSVEGGCLVTNIEYDLDDTEVGLPYFRESEPLEHSKIRQLQLYLERRDFDFIDKNNWFVLIDSKNKYLEKAYQQLDLKNYGKVQMLIDDYFFQEKKLMHEIQLTTNGDGEEINNYNRFFSDDYEPNDLGSDGSYCAACQQDPCMCSDPW
jgi:hypothetical protein